MLFRRRKKLGPLQRFRLVLWPKRSFSRSYQYFVKRVLRVRATPHAIAAGVAAGVFASWTPLIGFHFVVAFAIAYVAGGNMIAAGLGTAFGNPLTFPLIWASTYRLGHAILERGDETASAAINLGRLVRHVDFSQLWQPVIKPMLAGAVAPGLISAALFYTLTYYGVSRFQARRRQLLADRGTAPERPQASAHTVKGKI